MPSLTNFKAVYGSGIFIPQASTISALSLLFEKVYLPKNLNLVKEFSKQYRFVGKFNTAEELIQDLFFEHSEKLSGINVKKIHFKNDDDTDPLADLSDNQKKTALIYITKGINFALVYRSLFTEVFETQFFEGDGSSPFKVDTKKQAKKKTFKANISMRIDFNDEDDEFPRLLSAGYIPVVDNSWGENLPNQKIDSSSAKQLAALLAMKSIEIVFPRTQAVHPEIILEARSRLSDHLPPFWSAMLKLSVEMRNRIKETKSLEEMHKESQYLVDTTVMPALIDLKQKMLKEEKEWFFKILSPIQKGLRIMVGNPPLTQQQLLTNALVLGSDVMMGAAEHMQTIDALKNEAGLTFLLEAQKALSNKEAG